MQTPDGTRRTARCPFCTDGQTVVRARGAADALSLDSLIPAGTITVVVHDEESPCHSASDGRSWHTFPLRNLVSTHPADTLFRELAFLIRHLFLRVTCRLGPGRHIIFLRVYLIPLDLPVVRGRLHDRREDVVKEGRRYMRNVIPLIDQNTGLWEANEACINDLPRHFVPCSIDNRTMAEIYSDLPSPVLVPPKNENMKFSYHIASGGAIWGLRTILHGYQRRSVAAMLQKESTTSPVLDSSYIAVSCMSGTRCYVRPSTISVLRECPMFQPPRAGILCEELGTGKTVMVIALVLASAGQLPDPEDSTDERPVMTPLAYRHFPSAEYALARNRAGLGGGAIQRIPSLVELLVHHFSLFKFAMPRPAFADELQASHLWPFIRANQPFYHHYINEFTTEEQKISRRQNVPNLCPRTMYLSSATLIVVPLTLLGQWKSEINKHCHDCVRHLIIRPSMKLPDARTLAADYELIVMSDSCFRKESRKNQTGELYELEHCTCPPLEGSRVPDCHCPSDPGVTPLLRVRWKRLVIDEGHVTGTKAATINQFVRRLSIQHKWIVTGTPTSNILGLQLGSKAGEQKSDHYADSVVSVLDFSSSGSPTATSEFPGQDNESYVRIWGSYDRLSLRKLGTMIEKFLAVPQFQGESERFEDHVSDPLCDQRGPQPGAIDVLSQAMQMVMIRHRVEDVENDVLLPPMEHEIIYMDLDEYALKSYNAMQASVAVNAIDSKREGKDYLFHPSSAKDLQTTTNNSLQTLFWSSSDTLYNVDDMFHRKDEYIAHALKRAAGHEISREDLDLLYQALEHVITVVNDEMWRAMQAYPDVPFYVSGLDPAVFEAWARTRPIDGGRTIMHPDRLVNLRSLVRKEPSISKDDLIKEGNKLDRDERRAMSLKSGSSCKVHPGAQKMKEMAKEVQARINVQKKRIELMDASDEEEHEDHQDWDLENQTTPTAVVAAPAMKSSLLNGAKIGLSLSTKLNYILSEVRQYSTQEKFLIFSNSLLTLSQIGEALSLFEIKYLPYTNQEECPIREQCILTFETSDVHRILLMELKLGARGLNLISASRIIFCEPVWHPDVEAQAIKRVHRIGQTRPVTIKTLVIRSTAEEAMISRRQYLRSSDKVPTMTTESGMRDYLMHPRLLSEYTSSDSVNAAHPLDTGQVVPVDIHPNSFVDVGGGSSRVDVGSNFVTRESEGQGADVPTHKRVRFE